MSSDHRLEPRRVSAGAPPGRSRDGGRLHVAFGITLLYLVVEVLGSLFSGSLALLADAGHMLSDAGALGLALFAFWYAGRPATPEKTYGYHRMEILAAHLNGITLIAIALWILWQAWQRLQSPPEVLGLPMLVVAIGGLGVNAAAALLLSGDRKENLNQEAAFLHVLGDTMGSLGAIAAAILVLTKGWYLADPLASLLISLLIGISAWGLLRRSFHVLMEGTPHGVDVGKISRAILEVEGVRSVHDLHVWSITSGYLALSCHAVVDSARNGNKTLDSLRNLLHDRMGIEHCAIQLEERGLEERGIHP